MRVPHSPHSLRKVMPVASVKPSPSSDNEEFSMDSSTSINDMIKLNNMENNDYEKDQSVLSSKSPTSRPPRPTYTSKGRDGKYMVGVEASKMEKHREFFEKHIMDVTNNSQEHVKEGSTTMNNCLDKETLKSDQNTNMTAESIGNKGGFSTNNRGRERTRVSAVQRLVERKLAQKEKEKIRQREQDEKMRCTTVKNDLSSAHRRSASSNGYINIGASSRNRSRDRSWTRELDPRFLCSPSDLSSNNSNLPHDDAAATSSNNRNKTCRTVTENKYLANLLLRTSRSCDRLYGDSNEATKTFITISAGKPTRIREQSPCKRDKGTDQRWRGRSIDRTSTGSSINSENSSSDEEVSSPPIKVAKSFAPTFSPKLEPHSKRDVVLEKAAPLKSTGLLREFSFIKENSPVHEKETKVRKTSYTTEKTIQVNTASTKNRKLSVDINLLTKNFSTSPEDKFAFNHKRCNNSPTSDLPSTSSEFSTNSSSFQSSSSSSSLNGSDISSNSSLDGSNHESSPTPNPIRSSSKSSDGKSENDSHLSKRRISLEQRFKARLIQPTVFPSKDNSRQVNETNQNTSPQPRLRERKKSKLSAAAALKISQLNDSRIASNSPSSDSNSSNSSFQNISESEAYLYDVENIISKEGHKYQKVSVTTKSEAKAASSSVTNAVPRRRVSQGNLAGHSTHQNRLPKGPSPRRRKHSAPVHLNKNCDTFKEETEEEIFNNQEKFGFISGLTGSRSNLFTNRSASNIAYVINNSTLESLGDGITTFKSSSSSTLNPIMHENMNSTNQNGHEHLQRSELCNKNGHVYRYDLSNGLRDPKYNLITINDAESDCRSFYPSIDSTTVEPTNTNDYKIIETSGDGSRLTNYLSLTPSLTLHSSPDDCNLNENDVAKEHLSDLYVNSRSGVFVQSIESTGSNLFDNENTTSNYVVHCAPVSQIKKVNCKLLQNAQVPSTEANDSPFNGLNKDNYNIHYNTPISVDSVFIDSPKYNRPLKAYRKSDNNAKPLSRREVESYTDVHPEDTFYANPTNVNQFSFERLQKEENKVCREQGCIREIFEEEKNAKYNKCLSNDSVLTKPSCFVKSNVTEESSHTSIAADPKLSYLGEKSSCRIYRSTSPPSRNLTPCTSAIVPLAINSANINTKTKHEEEKVLSCCPQYFDDQPEMLLVPANNEKLLKQVPIKAEIISLGNEMEIISKRCSEMNEEEDANKGCKQNLSTGTNDVSEDEEEPCPLLKLHRLKMLQQNRLMQPKPKRDFEFQNNLEDTNTNLTLMDDRRWGVRKHPSSIISNTSNNAYPDDDLQSISTVSGSGINFFRNVVRKHGAKPKDISKTAQKGTKPSVNQRNNNEENTKNETECKDCESLFRQKVLIDRLVNDTILNKAWLAGGGLPPSRLAKALSSVSAESQHDKCKNSSNENLRNSSRLSTDSNSNSNLSPSKGSSIGIMVSSISNASTSCESRCAVHQTFPPSETMSCKKEEDNELEVHECDSISSAPFNEDVANVFETSSIADDEQSISSKHSTRSSVSMSTVSGSGLLFLRNYIKKKVTREKEQGVEKKPLPKWNEPRPNISQFFNSVPIPFPPVDEFYGPTYVLPDDVVFQGPDSSCDDDKFRRQSYCSTIADLLDNFDSEDSELRNLEWDDLEGDDDPMPEDIYNYYQLLQGIEQLGKLPSDLPLAYNQDDTEETQNEGRVTVLDNTQYKTPIVEQDEEAHATPFSNNFNTSAIPWKAELPGSYKDQPFLPLSYNENREDSIKDATKCANRSVSRDISRYSGGSTQQSNYCSTNFQSPLQRVNQQTEVDSRSSTVMYKTPTTIKSHSNTNLESFSTEQGDGYSSIPSSRFSNDNSFVFQDQYKTFNQQSLRNKAQTPPLAISSPYHKHEKRNSRLLDGSNNCDFEDNQDAHCNQKSKFGDEHNVETNESSNAKSAAQPIITSDHSSLASLFSKSCCVEDEVDLECGESCTPYQQIQNSKYTMKNSNKQGKLSNNRIRKTSLDTIQWNEKVNAPSSSFLHTNNQSKFGFGSGHLTGPSPEETLNANIMNRNKRLANFWEKSVSSNKNVESSTVTGQTQNLSRRLKEMTAMASNNNPTNKKPELQRSISENLKPDSFKNLSYTSVDNVHDDNENVNMSLNWNRDKRQGIVDDYDPSDMY